VFKISNIFSGKNAFSLYIPPEVVIKGNIETALNGRIEGKVEGDISLTGKLVVEENAVIYGNIQSHELIVHGKVFGNIICTHKAIISKSARVEGIIESPLLEIEENATLLNNSSDKKQEHKMHVKSIEKGFIITGVTQPPRVINSEDTWF
jgi:cytoskeletal protein CcmA (bactofilin family)